MNVSKNEYAKMVKKASPPSKIFTNCLKAFLVGGIICVIGELLSKLYGELGLGLNQVAMLVPVTLIFLSILLTALGVYDIIARQAGAGTLVPITGFANAVASPAIEFKTEGFVMGVGANMFKIAGPVIVFGTVASVIYGVIYWVMQIL